MSQAEAKPTPGAKPPRDETTVYSLGQSLVCFGVCAPAAMDAAAVCNQAYIMNPTGVGPWQHNPGYAAPDGGPNPRPCPDMPEARRHWLLVC